MLPSQQKSIPKLADRIVYKAFGAASLSFFSILLVLGYMWRPAANDVLAISLRRSPARIVLRSFSQQRKKTVEKREKMGASGKKASVPTLPVVKKPVISKKKPAPPKKLVKPAVPIVPKKKEPVKKPSKSPARKTKEKLKPCVAPVKKVLPESKKQALAMTKKIVPEKAVAKIEVSTSQAVTKTQPPEKQPVEKKTSVTPAPKKPEKLESIAPVAPMVAPVKNEPKEVVHPVKPIEAEPVVVEAPVVPLFERKQDALCDACFAVDADSSAEFDRDVEAFVGAIRRVWRLPRGLSSSLHAQVLLVLSAGGSVESASIMQSSGVVAYDLAARAALHRAVYPAVFWGKRIMVEFGKDI